MRKRNSSKRLHISTVPWRKRAGKFLPCSINRIKIGAFGLRRFKELTVSNLENTIHAYPENHLCHNDCTLPLRGWGLHDTMTKWYSKLDNSICSRIHLCGFKPLIDGLHARQVEHGLIQSLAEHWWDTTHTFHFQGIGEMTMTPKDFSAITGLHVSGTPIVVDKYIHLKKGLLTELMGPQISEANDTRVNVHWLYNSYRSGDCTTENGIAITVRAFVLGLLGAVLFAQEDNLVPMEYLSCLMDIDKIASYNWGGAALAFQYHQMDELCRGRTNTIGGMWRTWEVWAKEYFPAMRITEQDILDISFPKILRWRHSNGHILDERTMLEYYRSKLRHLTFDQVLWNPWGDTKDVPNYVKRSIHATKQRILLYTAQGGAWYLGERVAIQSLGYKCQFVPMQPPTEMLLPYVSTVKNVRSALYGRDAYNFEERSAPITIENYMKIFTPNNTTNGLQRNVVGCCCAKHNKGDNDDGLPMPPWTVLVPSTQGTTSLIRIPNDVEINDFNLPPQVRHVSSDKVTQLLRMIAGMQKLLVDNIISAREKLEESGAVIQNLRYQLYLLDNGSED